jgi:hypothetical protein
MHVLGLLRQLGIDRHAPEAERALELVREGVTWRGAGPPECDDRRFFDGELEVCINGQVVTAGAYFAEDVGALVERLLGEQLPDGGWNCDAPDGSMRSSFDSTICALEGLLEIERAVGDRPGVTEARRRGEAYLLDRRLFRRKSTGEAVERDRKGGSSWTRFAFPTWWH